MPFPDLDPACNCARCKAARAARVLYPLPKEVVNAAVAQARGFDPFPTYTGASAISGRDPRIGDVRLPNPPAKIRVGSMNLYDRKMEHYARLSPASAQHDALRTIAAVLDAKAPDYVDAAHSLDQIDDVLLALDESGHWPDAYGPPWACSPSPSPIKAWRAGKPCALTH